MRRWLFAVAGAAVVGCVAAQSGCSLGTSCTACRAIRGCGWCVDTTVAAIAWDTGTCESGQLNGPVDRSSPCALSSTNGWNWLACCSELTGNCERCVTGGDGACGHCVRDSSSSDEPCLERQYNQYRGGSTSGWWSASNSERGNCQQSGSEAFYDTTADECGTPTSSRYATLILGSLLVVCCCFCLVCFPCILLCGALAIGSWRSCCGCICSSRAGGRDPSPEAGGGDDYELREFAGLPAAMLVSGPDGARGSAPRVRADHFRQASSTRSSSSLPVATVHIVDAGEDTHPVARWGGGRSRGAEVELPVATAVAHADSAEILPTATVVIAARSD